MSENVIEERKYGNGIVGKLFHDQDATFEEDVGVITYNSNSRYVLGTTPVSAERDQEIAENVKSGELIGMMVYAYVHSGSTIKTSPFNIDFDSGRSGWVYCTKEQAIAEWGQKDAGMTAETKTRALAYLEGVVKNYDTYLQGDVYYFLIEDADREVVDSMSSLWIREDAIEQMNAAGERIAQEQTEASKPKP